MKRLVAGIRDQTRAAWAFYFVPHEAIMNVIRRFKFRDDDGIGNT